MDWIGKSREEAMLLTPEKRQKFLDYFRKGMTIKEAREKANITFDEAAGIIDLNIVTHECMTLNEKSV